MQLLIEARGKLSVVDIRYLNKDTLNSWIDSAMRNFIYDAKIFDQTKMKGNLQSTLLDLMMSNEALKKELEKPWNAKLPGHEKLANHLLKLNNDTYVDEQKAENDRDKECEPYPKKIKQESNQKTKKKPLLRSHLSSKMLRGKSVNFVKSPIFL